MASCAPCHRLTRAYCDTWHRRPEAQPGWRRAAPALLLPPRQEEGHGRREQAKGLSGPRHHQANERFQQDGYRGDASTPPNPLPAMRVAPNKPSFFYFREDYSMRHRTLGRPGERSKATYVYKREVGVERWENQKRKMKGARNTASRAEGDARRGLLSYFDRRSRPDAWLPPPCCHRHW